MSTAELVDAVWPDDAPGGAANALQSLVSRLRRSIGDPAAIVQAPTGYRLAITHTDVDAARFTELVRTGQQQLTQGRHPRR